MFTTTNQVSINGRIGTIRNMYASVFLTTVFAFGKQSGFSIAIPIFVKTLITRIAFLKW